MTKPTSSINDDDIARAAQALGCLPATVKAVCQVEAPDGGFDSNGQPRILFEGHKFSKWTHGAFDSSHPTISYPVWTRKFYARGQTADVRNVGEHERLRQAVQLNREAALKSTSWGRFQMLGENYAACGFQELQDFINAMYAGESEQLDAFMQFVRVDKGGHMLPALRLRDWATFARLYNGTGYAKNKYDKKLAAAFKEAS